MGDAIVSPGDAIVLVGDAIVLLGDAIVFMGDAIVFMREAIVFMREAIVFMGEAIVCSATTFLCIATPFLPPSKRGDAFSADGLADNLHHHYICIYEKYKKEVFFFLSFKEDGPKKLIKGISSW